MASMVVMLLAAVIIGVLGYVYAKRAMSKVSEQKSTLTAFFSPCSFSSVNVMCAGKACLSDQKALN